MDYLLDSEEKINALDASGIEEKLAYLPAALHMTRQEIGEEKALLGFGGSPWTLAAYMTEGGSLKDCFALKSMFYSNRPLFDKLMNKVTSAVIDLFKMQSPLVSMPFRFSTLPVPSALPLTTKQCRCNGLKKSLPLCPLISPLSFLPKEWATDRTISSPPRPAC